MSPCLCGRMSTASKRSLHKIESRRAGEFTATVLMCPPTGECMHKSPLAEETKKAIPLRTPLPCVLQLQRSSRRTRCQLSLLQPTSNIRVSAAQGMTMGVNPILSKDDGSCAAEIYNACKNAPQIVLPFKTCCNALH